MNTSEKPIRLNKIYCAISGIKFYLADTLGLDYVAEANKIHPIFLDTNNLRALLKLERNKKAAAKPEILFTKDWQDINLGIESDFIIPRADQIISKSFIVGIILTRLKDLKLSRTDLDGRQTHELNISLCKHRRRAQLLWWARRLCNWPRNKNSARINLDTIWDSGQERPQYKTKVYSDSIGAYLSAIIEDDDSRLPRLRGRSQASVTIYDQDVALRSRKRRAERPLNGQHIDWGIGKALSCIRSLKAAKVINKKQHTSMEMCITHWADYSLESRERLGHRLIELSNSTVLKQDYSTTLERIGYAFVTNEIVDMAKIADYTMANTFLGAVVEKSTSEKRPSLLNKLRGLK